MTADASTAPRQTRPALREALSRYERPDGDRAVMGVTGPKGEVEYRRGGAVAYHSRTPRSAGQQMTPCSAYPQGCYHADGSEAFGKAVAGLDDVAIYTALEVLYGEWGPGAQPASQRPARQAPGGRARTRARQTGRPLPGRAGQ